MIIVEFLSMGQIYWSYWGRYFIKRSPKGFQYLSINMPCPFKEYEAKPSET